MTKKLTLTLALFATCLSLVSEAQASAKSIGRGPSPISGTDLGSGR